MKKESHDDLIDELLDGVISDADFLRLEAGMIVDEDVRRAYYERLKLHTVLEEEVGSSSLMHQDGLTSPVGSIQKPFRLDRVLGVGIAALLCLIGVMGWKIAADTKAYKLAVSEPVASGFGVLAKESSETRWAGQNLFEGDMLPAGELSLLSGMVKLELFSGVDVVVYSPARLEVVSDYSVRVEEGKILCRVPESLDGFTVRVPSGEVIDFGTEFAIEVGEDFESVDVVDGLVEWRGDSGEIEKLRAGHGLRKLKGGGVEKQRNSVSSMQEIERGFEETVQRRHLDWDDSLKEIRNDPNLLALYSFESLERGSSRVIDLSGSGHHGELIRTGRETDRWGEAYGGIDFTPMGSRIRLDIDGEFTSLSSLCWVKIDSLDRLYNSLFLTDGHELGEPHWQIMNDGRMVFSVKALQEGNRRDKHIAYSPVIWTPEKSGQWMHLATVFDGVSQTITHYVNGSAVSIDQIPESLHAGPVRIGEASIGNWSKPRYRDTAEFRVRNLNGTIDEFLLYSEPLSASEINRIYKSGKP